MAPTTTPPASAPAAAKPAASDVPPPPAVPKTGEMKKPNDAPAIEGPKAENAKPSAGLTTDEIAAIKELPETEQATATKQVACPVSSHHLGSMGKPIKVSAEGRTFFICCEGCEEKVKSDPKAVIAKLDQK
jgi:YHS domain-containing protein